MYFEQRDAAHHCGFCQVASDEPAAASYPYDPETQLHAELARRGLLRSFLELRALIGEYRNAGRLVGEPSARAQLVIMDQARALRRAGLVKTVKSAITVAFLAVMHHWIR